MMQNKYISSLVTQVDLDVQIISTRVISFMPKYWQKIRFENSFSGSVPQQSLSVRPYVSVLHARGNPFCGLRPEVGSVHGTIMRRSSRKCTVVTDHEKLIATLSQKDRALRGAWDILNGVSKVPHQPERSGLSRRTPLPTTRKKSLIYALDILMKSCRFCS